MMNQDRITAGIALFLIGICLAFLGQYTVLALLMFGALCVVVPLALSSQVGGFLAGLDMLLILRWSFRAAPESMPVPHAAACLAMTVAALFLIMRGLEHMPRPKGRA